LALRLLSLSEASFAVTQLGTRSGGLQLKNPLILGPLRLRDDAKSAEAFMNAMAEELTAQGNVLLVPREGFAVVDAVAIVGSGEERRCLFLQVTVAVKHPVTGHLAVKMLAKLIEAAGGATKCALVYVLPNNANFSQFRLQSVPECGKCIRQYKIALKTESGAKKQKIK